MHKQEYLHVNCHDRAKNEYKIGRKEHTMTRRGRTRGGGWEEEEEGKRCTNGTNNGQEGGMERTEEVMRGGEETAAAVLIKPCPWTQWSPWQRARMWETHRHTSATALGQSATALSPRTGQRRRKEKGNRGKRMGEAKGLSWEAYKAHLRQRGKPRMHPTKL